MSELVQVPEYLVKMDADAEQGDVEMLRALWRRLHVRIEPVTPDQRETRTLVAFLNLGSAARRVVEKPSKRRLDYLAECLADLDHAAAS